MRDFNKLTTICIMILMIFTYDGNAQEKALQPDIRIVMVGDSTMATYTVPREDRPDLTGWGQVFGNCFNHQVSVINHAESGRSAKEFIDEGRWAKALEEKPDYLFIQFGHNDHLGEDGSTVEFCNKFRKFVDDTRSAKIKPILVTPVTRRKFLNGKIVTSLKHYAEAILKVGKEKAVPVIDLHNSSVKLHNDLGEKGSEYFNPSQTDQTHFTRKGAKQISRLVAEELPSKVPSLALYLKTPYLKQSRTVYSNVVDRLIQEGIRAKSRGDVKKMQNAGFNLVLPWGGQLLENATKSSDPNSETILNPGDFSEESLKELKEWSVESKKHNQIMMHMIYVAGETSVRFLAGLEGDLRKYVQTGKGITKKWPAHQYRHVVDWNGDAALWAPCPLERRYWNGFIRPQLERVARTLNETGASGGAALELETYCFYSIYPGLSSQKKSFCFCDHCFKKFVKSRDDRIQQPEVRAKQRFDWLNQRGFLSEYEKFLENDITKIIGEMLVEVRKIDPDFLFGFYPYTPCWFHDGLIRGGGTLELPCLLFPASEYNGGYMKDAPYTFFGDVSTPSSVNHIKKRNLPALYAGGLWAKAINSPEAIATAMDRMLLGADGYWVYDRVPPRFWEQAQKMNQWSTRNRDLLKKKPVEKNLIVQNVMKNAVAFLKENPQKGIFVENNQIVARYTGESENISLFGNGPDYRSDYHQNWQGRGKLPPLDSSKDSTNGTSIRFKPSISSDTPVSPYIDFKIQESQAKSNQKYELAFWVKSQAKSPVRFWVGQANSKQHPTYMYYRNFMLRPDNEWKQKRIEVRYKKDPPLVLRFWVPPTEGTVWLDDITLRPVQDKVIEIPISAPNKANGWNTINWKLSPANARYEAEIIDPEDRHTLRSRLYSGDNIASLGALENKQTVILRLQVSPNAIEPVVLENVQIRILSKTY